MRDVTLIAGASGCAMLEQLYDIAAVEYDILLRWILRDSVDDMKLRLRMSSS